MSSRPLRRQCLRKGSMSKWALKPSSSVTVCASRLMVMRVAGWRWSAGGGFRLRLRSGGEDDAVLAGVGVEDVGEGGRDDGAEAELVDGPGGVLAGGAAAEVLLGDQNFSALVLGLVEHEVGVGLAGVGAFLDA